MLGHNGGVEADALCLAQARFQMGHAAHLAAEADLADGDGLFVYRQVKQLDASAMQTGRSQAVSSSFRPPMMLM